MITSALEIIHASNVTAAPPKLDLVPPSHSEDPPDDDQQQLLLLLQQQQQQQRQDHDAVDDSSRASSAASPAEVKKKVVTVTGIDPTTKLRNTTTRLEPVRCNKEIHAMFRRRKKFMFLKHVENGQEVKADGMITKVQLQLQQ
jgi:hypothetical protein